MAKGLASIWKTIQEYKRVLILVLTPVLLCPLPALVPDEKGRCAYSILIMAVYWITEVCPLAVTSLLPLVLFPLLGVVEAKQISPPYFSDTNILFMGGLLLAVAVEYWNLHKRIALFVLLKVGVQPRRLLFGFMSVTAFLSMWLSNTATTAMMFPIAQAVLHELREGTRGGGKDGVLNNGTALEMNDKVDNQEKNGSTTREKTDSNESVENPDAAIVRVETDKDEQSDHRHIRLCKGTFLSIAYAANIGGTGTLTGTGPNLILSGQSEEIFPDSGGIGFADWFIYAFPEMILLLFVAWVWIQWVYLETRLMDLVDYIRRRPKKNNNSEAVKKATQILQQQYNALGPVSFAEVALIIHFITLALLWLFRDPKFIDGWAIVFKKGFVRDGTVGILVAFSLFNFPSRKPKIFSRLFSKNEEYDLEEAPNDGRSDTLLDWPTVSQKFAWNIVLLLGAGFAMAKAAKDSGLSLWLGQQLAKLDSVPTFVIVLITASMLCAFTEVTSNTATATIFLPILGTLATSLDIHPWRLMVPATVACSFAFMLPVATPPNAIVFASGYLKVADMAKTGLFMNITSVAVLMLWLYTFGTFYFDLDTFPNWAKIVAKNSTEVMDCVTKNSTM